ncbi:MAG: GntR family transcriptional regulator [Burkholderiales bacterium]|nr:GntR family transcriptional regulator [Burkholderiales bacterium]
MSAKTPQRSAQARRRGRDARGSAAAAKPAANARRPAHSLGISAYERLRQAIQGGEFAPGDRLLEDAIAQRFSISRTPVREALRRLEDEGLLVHESHRGMTVAQLDYQMIMELYSMRYVLEGAAAAMAARNATEIEIEMLNDMIAREQAAAATVETMAEHNRRLHLAIYQCSHNRYLLKVSNVLSNPLALLSRTAFASASRRAAVCDEHRAIVEAIGERDPERAQQAAQAHMQAAQRVRMAVLSG